MGWKKDCVCFVGSCAQPHLPAPSPIAAGGAEADNLGEVKEAVDDAEVILCTGVCFCVHVCLICADLSDCDVELCEKTYLGIWDSHSDLLPAG